MKRQVFFNKNQNSVLILIKNLKVPILNMEMIETETNFETDDKKQVIKLRNNVKIHRD